MTSTTGRLTFPTANPYSPIGTVLADGSTSLRMSPREFQVAMFVATGASYKRIAACTAISPASVGKHVAEIASRIPGAGNPRQRVSAWMWMYGGA